MADYATIGELVEYGYQVREEDAPLLSRILTRSSRLFDIYVGVKAGYFATGESSQTASAKNFWGDGTDYLKISPYLAGTITGVTMPTGFTVPTYQESSALETGDSWEFFLIKTYGDNHSRLGALEGEYGELDGANFAQDLNLSPIGWPKGIKVAVTAKWGFDALLEDVKEAVLETAIAIWRGKDQAFARVVNLESNQQIIGALPDRARLIADKYRQGRAMFV